LCALVTYEMLYCKVFYHKQLTEFYNLMNKDKHPVVVANAVTCVINELEQVQTN